jgi:hypothetical protein
VKTYPRVLSESDTLDRVLDGASLARYGDGEFKMAEHGAGIKSQDADADLSARLRAILLDSGSCLVGIPNIHSETPKAAHWNKFTRYASLLADRRSYVSSFITRPDSAPWINVADYWARLESLWVGQDVTLVRGSSKSLTAEDLVGAGTITEIIAPRQHAWAEYGSLLKRIGRPKRALICLGPTATVMAVDLCARGVHAIDLGHVGMFLRKMRRGEPMWVTREDKVQPA